MKTLLFMVAMLSLCTATLHAQEQNRETYLASLPVAYQMEGMDKVRIEHNREYSTTSDGQPLRMDIYYPPAHSPSVPLPVVIFINGSGANNTREWRMYTDWGRLTAVSGMIAITYSSQARSAESDSKQLIEYVRTNAAELGINAERIGLWSASANVPACLSIAMQPERQYIRCAVAYYGMGELSELRRDLPVFVARAGQDHYVLNSAIDKFIRRAIDEDIDITFVNYVEGHHAFDIWDSTKQSSLIIQQTLNFMQNNLLKPDQPSLVHRAPTPARFVALANKQGIAQALELYRATKQKLPKAALCKEANINLIGYHFLQEGKTHEAIEVFKLLLSEYPDSPNAYDSMADGYAAEGNTAQAIAYAEKAIALLDKNSTLTSAAKDMIRQSAAEKISRLRSTTTVPPTRKN